MAGILTGDPQCSNALTSRRPRAAASCAPDRGGAAAPAPQTERQHADGPVKTATFGTNSARMYTYDIRRAGLESDRVTAFKAAYETEGAARSNYRYGYVVKG